MDKWVRLYADLVRSGRRKITEVPTKYQAEVKKLLATEAGGKGA